jgi:hypothetical protein
MKPLHTLIHAAFIALAVVFFGKNNILTGAALSCGIIAFVIRDRRPVVIVALLLAGFTGFIMEYLCTAVWRAWAYSHPSTVVMPFGVVYRTLPGWLFLFWGYFVITMMNISAVVEKYLRGSAFWTNRILKRSIAILAWSIIIELVILNNAVFGPARYTHYLVLCAAMILFWHRPGDLVLFYIAAACATAGEWVCVQRGLWTYRSLYVPELGVPVTLPLAWGFAVLIIARSGAVLTDRKKCIQKS